MALTLDECNASAANGKASSLKRAEPDAIAWRLMRLFHDSLKVIAIGR